MTTTAERKVEFMSERLRDGYTIYLATALRVIQFTQNSVSKWRAAGVEPFYARNGSLYVVEGTSKGKPRFVCADYCQLTARGC